MPPILALFTGGAVGHWRVERNVSVRGEPLAEVSHLSVCEASELQSLPASATWGLRGSTGHVRYVERDEKLALARVTPPLARAEASCAALIPIRKSDAWWDLAQDERRVILEQQSRHIEVGLAYLPAIARRLYHARELGQPFDFLTWFEFAPEHSARFDELLVVLRASLEWRYVEREVELRLSRVAAS
jgi:chlorite dismutase